MTNYQEIIGKTSLRVRAWDGSAMLPPDEVGDHAINNLNQLPFVLMQSTGLRDKNGVEIFEGDVVKMHSGHDGIGADFGISKYLVQHRMGGACFDMLHEDYLDSDRKIGTTFDSGSVKSIEVIGNVFQDPNLLPN